jgi:hypothetical protein
MLARVITAGKLMAQNFLFCIATILSSAFKGAGWSLIDTTSDARSLLCCGGLPTMRFL